MDCFVARAPRNDVDRPQGGQAARRRLADAALRSFDNQLVWRDISRDPNRDIVPAPANPEFDFLNQPEKQS
jgi:hypothetical protein